MKVLSVKNPWAYLIVHGIVDVTNQIWETDCRGKIMIHVFGNELVELPINLIPKNIVKEANNLSRLKQAGKNFKMSDLCQKYVDFIKICDDFYDLKKENYMKSNRIIGIVELVEVKKEYDSLFSEKGKYHWILKNPEIFKIPIENIEKQSRLWDYELK